MSKFTFSYWIAAFIAIALPEVVSAQAFCLNWSDWAAVDGCQEYAYASIDDLDGYTHTVGCGLIPEQCNVEMSSGLARSWRVWSDCSREDMRAEVVFTRVNSITGETVEEPRTIKIADPNQNACEHNPSDPLSDNWRYVAAKCRIDSLCF